MNDKRKELKQELNRLSILIDRGRKRIAQIQNELEGFEKKKLIVSEHAIKRFKERIENMPTKTIKTLFWQSNLQEKYLKHGAGRHRMNNKIGVIALIKDNTVITVLNDRDPMVRLEHLQQYMEYWIDKRCEQVYHPAPTLHFRDFIKTLYR